MNRISMPTVIVDFARNYEKPRIITDNLSGCRLTYPVIITVPVALLRLFVFVCTTLYPAGNHRLLIGVLFSASRVNGTNSETCLAPQFYSPQFPIRSSPPDDKRFGDSMERRPLQLLNLSISMSSRWWERVSLLYP
jgi:hypothetical protein